MAQAVLSVNLTHIANNWTRLDGRSAPHVETAAVVKADAYGLDAARVVDALHKKTKVRSFFVATAEEGIIVRNVAGSALRIFVFSGHMAGDTALIREYNLIPMLNSIEQIIDHLESLPGHPFGIQLDTGMNRLGLELEEWNKIKSTILPLQPELLMSHLACADTPEHPMNAQQLAMFKAMTNDCGVARSLCATGGILLGAEYHFDMTRPGIGLYGGAPFTQAEATVHLSLPVIQTRMLEVGEAVGYGADFVAQQHPICIATLGAGYADGLMRALAQGGGQAWVGDISCPIVGRVSMDMIAVDITHLRQMPQHLELLCPRQSIDDLAAQSGTIGYEILTQLGRRYTRQYVG